ncbi:MAG: cytochrome c biogenesis protein CcsA [Myxococcota bacterium]
MITRTTILQILLVTTAAVLGAASWMVFLFAPEERVMGFVQKIFYFHVPSAWMMLLSVPIMAVGAIGYLATRKPAWDRVTDSAVELSILFGVLALITGPLWGRKAWGVFWVWDARLTSSLVLVMTLVACKIVRSYAGSSARQVAAALSVLAVLNAAFVWVSVDIWRGTHPPKLVQTLEDEMRITFRLCAVGFLLAYASLFWMRLRMGKLKDRVDELELRMLEDPA